MNIIITNHGDDSVALMQWAIDHAIANLFVVSVDTGFAAHGWEQRLTAVAAALAKHQLSVVRLKAELDFAKLMLDRGEFPTPKFQWCAGILKGLPLLEWLDEVDPRAQATVILSSRNSQSQAPAHLPERIAESEYYGSREVWYPLRDLDDRDRDALVEKFGVKLLGHRSLECEPCVNSQLSDWQRMTDEDVSKTDTLEQQVGSYMFTDVTGAPRSITEIVENARAKPACGACSRFDMGCGQPYVCGQ